MAPASGAMMTAATFVMSLLRDRLLDPHPEVAAALLRAEEDLLADADLAHGLRSPIGHDEANRLRVLDDRRVSVARRLRLDQQEGPAFHLDPTDDHAACAALRVDRQDLVPCAELAEVLRLAVRQEHVRVDGARGHAKWAGSDVPRLDRLAVDQEEARGAVPDEHALPHAEHRACVDAHAVPEAERADRRDLRAEQPDAHLDGLQEAADLADVLRGRRGEQDPVHADLHRLEEQLRLRGVADLDEEPRAAPLEGGDEVLEGDDLPVLRPHDDVLRRAL